MAERLCSCCGRNVPLDQQEWGPGICELCKTFSPILRHAILTIKWNINGAWLTAHREDIIKALFAQIGEKPEG